MTGAATSVIGMHPMVKDKEGNKFQGYSDPYQWIDAKTIPRPNEKAKLVAEKTCWNVILNQTGDNKTTLSALLPYFIIGEPMYREAFNSSCLTIAQILNNEQTGFPEVHLPTIDVQDLARAHIACMVDKNYS
jgi:nucleoside-diphosphate-sugar epimerase